MKLGHTSTISLRTIQDKKTCFSCMPVLKVGLSLLVWVMTVMSSRHLPRGTGTVAATLSPS